MISSSNLKYLSNQKVADAKCLLNGKRRSAATYLMGYAIELSLKSKVANTLGFSSGFPQTAFDFSKYSPQILTFNAIPTGLKLTKLREIKNHDLKLLLKYSGAEARVVRNCYNEWLVVKDWNPENRYKVTRLRDSQATGFIRAAVKFLREIS